MAFQDFDLISERRKNERKQKLKKRIAIGVVSTIVLAGLIAAAVFVVVTKSNDTKAADRSSNTASSEKHVSHGTEKAIKTVCNSTDYKTKCEGTLSKAVQKDPKMEPKDLLEASIKVAVDEVTKAFDKITSMKFDTEQAKGAFEDCKTLMDDAKEELGFSADAVGSADMKKLSSKAGDINNWLSAVISYHQTCIDGFADGKLKTDIEKLLKDSSEFVSNSLAIVSQVTSFLSMFQPLAASRHLLSEKPDGFPAWMNHEEKRMLKAADDKPTPNVTVAQDGSGNFKTISEALAAIPKNYQGRYVVYVKQGVYDETVTVTKNMVNLTLYGDGSQKSIITGNKNFVDGVGTFKTASFVVLGDGFLGKAMGFRNTAGPEKHQAVAARVQADRAIFVNCRFEGYQDTLYAQTHRQFYRSCVISGTIDFIFGDAAAVLQNCIMMLRMPLENQQNIVTAQGRVDQHETTGIVLQNCEIKADDTLIPNKDKIKSYLGRPWKEFSRTIVMESKIDDIINPDGWLPWDGDFALKTLYYAEFKNTGPGASTNARVKWPGYKVIDEKVASQFTVDSFLTGGSWISGSGVPFRRDLSN